MALSTIGYFIKPQIFIFFIAVCAVTSFVEAKKILTNKKVNRENVYIVCLCVFTIIVCYFSVKSLSKIGFKTNKELKLGISHFLMMGWNFKEGGVYSREDVNYSKSFGNPEERKKANIDKFRERINDMGITGVTNMLIKKTLTNFNDGTFCYGGEGKFFLEEYDTGNKIIRSKLSKIYIENGKYFKLFQLSMQIIWIATIFFNIFAYNKKNDNRIHTLCLSIFGLTMFELLFEARARYLFAYAPVYIILATIGFNNVFERVYVILKSKKKYKVLQLEK